MRKFILITIIIILASTLALLAVFYFDKGSAKKVIQNIADTQVSLITKFKTNEEQKRDLIRISDSGASTYGISPNQKEIVFFDNNGVFKIIDFVGNFKFKGEGPFAENIANGVWAPAKFEGVITTIESDGVKKILYDYANGKVSQINNNIQNIDYSPDSERITYSFFDSDIYEGNISISRSDGTGFVNIFKTRLSDIAIDWVKDDLITFYKKSVGENELVDLFRINNKGEGFEKILSRKVALRVLWAFDGKSLAYSTKVNGKDRLYYKFIDSDKEDVLDLEASAENCVWSKSNVHLICFGEGAFYKIDVVDGDKDRIYSLRDDIEAGSLKLSPQEDYLFFISKKDGQLYSLSLN